MASCYELPGTKNLQMSVDGAVLYLYCDLSKDLGPSSSGKSTLITSSSGNKPIGKSGAFLGLNIFTKSLDKRDLTAKGVGELQSADFTAVGDGCEWRIEEDAKTLRIKIDFAAVKPRPGASGKSILLATTCGNKPIASTGLICGLNCYHPAATAFDVTQLAAGAAPEDALQVGASVDLEGGFTVTYAAADKLSLQYRYLTADMADGHVASMPAFRLGDLTVALCVGAVKAARARTEKDASAAPPSSDTRDVATNPHGQLLQAEDEDDKVRNVFVKCAADADADTTATPADAYDLELTVDPTARLGRSSSGKSMTVASTGGYQRVVDAAGRVVCRVSLNAYVPAPPFTADEIAAAVETVLSAKEAATLSSLSFKDVLSEVMAEMGAAEAMKDSLRDKVKEKVGSFLKSQA